MKKLILIIMLLASTSVFAHNGKKYCGECYHQPYPHYPAYTYVVDEKLEDTCVTALSVCTAGKKGADAFYEYNIGFVYKFVVLLSNGKVVRYSEKRTDFVHNFVDAVNLKSENADAAVGNTDDKVIDEKGDALKVCKSDQDVLVKTYGYCK